jgi:hypothetical protein
MPGCNQAALVWLTPDELAAFANGERMFDISPRGLKLRVTDNPPAIVGLDIVKRLSPDDPAAQAVGRGRRLNPTVDAVDQRESRATVGFADRTD